MSLHCKDKFLMSNAKIPVYKIIEIKHGQPGPPFQLGVYDGLFPTIVACEVIQPKWDPKVQAWYYGKGYIHAYLNKDEALNIFNQLKSKPGCKVYQLYKGYVPFDVRIGINDKTICARKIYLTERICV